MSNWAPIVFGRTFEVDFRFIATPKDLTAKEKSWAQQHILVTTRSPERLRKEPPRWSVLKKEDICIVGVTCMASTLSEEMTQDIKQRGLYIFVGYVSRHPFPKLPPMDIELFKHLYEYVGYKWHEKPYDTSRHDPIYTEYDKSLPEFIKAVNIDNEDFFLNQSDSNIVRVWPDQPQNRENLWQAADEAKVVTLCLGLAIRNEALQAFPFFNVVAIDVQQKKDLLKVTQHVLAPPIPDDGPAPETKPPINYPSEKFLPFVLIILVIILAVLLFIGKSFFDAPTCKTQNLPGCIKYPGRDKGVSNSQRTPNPTPQQSNTPKSQEIPSP